MKRYENWYNGNFKTHAEEIAHMKELREQGYNNVEIAKMVGRNLNTVYKDIGKQPKIMTELSKQLAGERRVKMNQNRKIAVATAKRLEYERKVAEKEAILAERVRIAEQITKLRESYEAKTRNLIAVGHEILDIQPAYNEAMNVLRSA